LLPPLIGAGWRSLSRNAILRTFLCRSPSFSLSDPTAAPNTAADSSDRSFVSAEPIPELIRLGEQLREARQSQGLAIEELAGRLHLGNDQLQALENGDRTHLPEAVFVIAQAKRVASVLGIDVEGTIAQLRQSRLMQTPSVPSVPLPPASSAPFPAARPLAGPMRTAPLPRSPSRSPGSATYSSRRPLLGLLVGLAALAAAFGMVRALRQAVIRPPASPRAEPSAIPSPHSLSIPSATSPAAQPAAAEAVLVLRASEASWVEVRTLAGERMFEGTLQGEKRFPLGRGLEVMAGRPYAVTASVGEQPPRALGKVDEIVWRRFLTPMPALSPTESPAPTPPAPAP
jgi:cytoskeleton protein RodZ